MICAKSRLRLTEIKWKSGQFISQHLSGYGVNLVSVASEVPIIGEHYFQVLDIYCTISAPNLYTYSGRMNL